MYNENIMKFIGKTQKLLRRNNKKIISIHNEKLRGLRNNLRIVIRLATLDRINIFHAFWLENKGIEKAKLQTEEWDLRFALKNSTCQCSTCSSYDRDMIYLPELKAWNCVECWKEDKLWLPSKQVCECGIEYMPCPRCSNYYCPKCYILTYKYLKRDLIESMAQGISKEEYISELWFDDIPFLNGECEDCGFPIYKHYKNYMSSVKSKIIID